MKVREFNSHLKTITGKNKLIDITKISLLSNDVRSQMVDFLCKKDGPILKDLIPPNFNLNSLFARGYLHETESKKEPYFTFLHRCTHKIK